MVRRKVITRSYTHVGWRDATGYINMQQIWDFIGVARPALSERSTFDFESVSTALYLWLWSDEILRVRFYSCNPPLCNELISQCLEEFKELFFLDIMSRWTIHRSYCWFLSFHFYLDCCSLEEIFSNFGS
jgi:hypothetical protein